jgi:hypothetical protein
MQIRDRVTAVVTTLFVWSLAGALFGGLFIGLHEVLIVLGLVAWQPVVVASVAAAMTTVAFYSSMPIALVGAASGVVSSVGYLVVAGPRLELGVISAVAAGVGLVAGTFFTWMGQGGSRPLAETITGLLAGLGAGVILATTLTWYPHPVGAFVMAAGVVALVGSLFQLNEHWIVDVSRAWLPASLAAPLVSSLVASVVGASIWMVSGTAVAALDMETVGAVQQVLTQVPAGFLGGMLGGAVTGFVLELLGFHIEEREAG